MKERQPPKPDRKFMIIEFKPKDRIKNSTEFGYSFYNHGVFRINKNRLTSLEELARAIFDIFGRPGIFQVHLWHSVIDTTKAPKMTKDGNVKRYYRRKQNMKVGLLTIHPPKDSPSFIWSDTRPLTRQRWWRQLNKN